MLYSTTFVSLDGIVSDPHVWFPRFASDESLALLADHMDDAGAMLIGRRTYEEFAEWWPRQPDSVPLATRTNAMTKYVVSTTLRSAVWHGSELLPADDLAGAVAGLRERHRTVAVAGSATLQRWLLRTGLLDEMRLYLAPVVLGGGLRLFDGTVPPAELQLTDRRALPNGVQYLAYALGGDGAAASGADAQAARG